ncbi:DUF6011 domain-containing protein [Streptomyces sp. E11-3]|uniref:DUF6011 domain-containing protein n=1 Tax=Streptomyces sp. E11-3 TaxID=3110112 RepID=UPI0039814DF7
MDRRSHPVPELHRRPGQRRVVAVCLSRDGSKVVQAARWRYCRCCGARLRDPESLALGYGPGCYAKVRRAREGHGGLIRSPECDQGQAEEISSDLALSRLERVTGIEPA